jgi:hypothetical protein
MQSEITLTRILFLAHPPPPRLSFLFNVLPQTDGMMETTSVHHACHTHAHAAQ